MYLCFIKQPYDNHDKAFRNRMVVNEKDPEGKNEK